jgi:hypothetical protein
MAGTGTEDDSKLSDVTKTTAQKRFVIFGDNFESGNTQSWIPESTGQPNCNCYFSSDCKVNDFCYWGPGGPFTEDVCNWRTPKPSGLPGNGCTEDVPNPGPICDGICSPSTLGSLFGHENTDLVIQGIELWSEAMLKPSLDGGGPVDPELAAQALGLPFKSESAAILLGRHVADVLILAGGMVFYDYFCHYENGDPDPEFWVDLSDDPCRYEAGVRSVDAIIAELHDAGSGMGLIDGIQGSCSQWGTLFEFRCGTGAAAIECVKNRIRGYRDFLTLPKEY